MLHPPTVTTRSYSAHSAHLPSLPEKVSEVAPVSGAICGSVCMCLKGEATGK